MSTKEYAGFWLRFVAYIIDYIVIQVVQSFIIIPILGALGFGMFTASQDINWDQMSDAEIFGLVAAVSAALGAAILLSMAILILYYAIMESSKYQATLGKLALGLKVTDMNGNKLDFWKAFLRQIGKIVSGMILMIGYIMAGFTDKKQALHDMIAGALVVKK
ncbi:MAG: RDD family protein [Marinoscillum sp.]